MDRESLNDRYRKILAAQLEMNKDTWSRLQDLGVTDTTEIALDFSYFTPGEAAAAALVEVLRRETDYEVKSVADENATWAVTGSTQPTAVSLEILDQWVDWMVTAGLHQDCEFDGWGAMAP